MTTVICDGKYLIADHRTTTRVSENEVRADVTSGKQTKLATVSDSRLKVFLPPEGVLVTAKKEQFLVAIACAGSSAEIAKVRKYITTLKSAKYGFSALMFNIKDVCAPTSALGVIALFSDGVSKRVVFHPKVGLEIKTKPQGKLNCIGSGSTILKAIDHLLPQDTHLEDKFFLSATTDKFTSPSYSVYSLEHNKLYTCVTPSLMEVKARADALLKRVDLTKVKLQLNAAISDD